MDLHLKRLIINNYRVLKKVDIDFNDKLNIIVGDNECGKSTILEAINIALSGQLNGRNILYELHPFLFNIATIREYIENLKNQNLESPPLILIELYFSNNQELTSLKGTNNSLKEDIPGVSFSIEFDDSYAEEFNNYIKNPDEIRTIPIEYYKIKWLSFANATLTSRSIPFKPTLIDASTIRNNNEASKYVLDIIKDYLQPEQRVSLSLSYRKMKDSFLEDESIIAINSVLSKEKDAISHKSLSISLDTASKTNWENSIVPCLDDIPLPLVGKGEQNSIKIKLSMKASSDAHIFLIEEPENHLSHSNLNKLIGEISNKIPKKQLIITTHSSFVLNKLGIDNVLLFSGNRSITLKSLSPDTHNYFMKLPGHDTLRLILSKKAILVEGPSDELIVQKAFKIKYDCMSLEKGIDVICVKSLAFKRFLEISNLLDIEVTVITDNDGDLEALQEKYRGYQGSKTIKISFDKDPNYKTLEPQLLKHNDLPSLNNVFGTNYESDNELLDYMKKNKTDCALKIFESNIRINLPSYIIDAI